MQNININLIDNNTGQLNNVPQNPRDLTNDGFELAKKSIAEFPEMLQVRTLVVVHKNDRYVTIGGNQRLRAMRDLGYTEAPCMVVNWNDDQIQRFIIADNLEYGVWNYDMLANDWESEQLIEWGLELPDYDGEILNKEQIDSEYTNKIKIPTYSPNNEKPLIEELVNTEKTQDFITEIKKLNAPEEIKDFLIFSAYRHNIFNYSKIADYYAHSDKEIQDIMEKLALVIIDYNKAYENGYVTLTKDLAKLYEESDNE